jgi:aminoglycoside 6'-N-acetyltransferase
MPLALVCLLGTYRSLGELLVETDMPRVPKGLPVVANSLREDSVQGVSFLSSERKDEGRHLMQTEDLDFTFKALQPTDLPLVATWLSRPHVERWWREPSDLATVEQNYRPMLNGSDQTEGFIVHLHGRQIGFVQRYLIADDADWRETVRSALGEDGGIGIDYLVGEQDLVGKGLGRRMISEFVDDSWRRYPSVDRVVVALQQENIASWRALEACGFRRAWAGPLASSDPSDRGPSFIYVADRSTR